MKPVVLVVLDGWGWSPEKRGNAIRAASTPVLDGLSREFPSGLLQASGISVGIPWGEPGNSEVGHFSMGTGQIRAQPLVYINRSLSDGTFFENPALKEAAEHTRRFSSSLHIAGLVGTGSVHSYLSHLYAIIEFASREKLERVFLHLFTDGRDSPPKAAVQIIGELERYLENFPNVRLATVIGRHYAMDRDRNWERTEKTLRLLVTAAGRKTEDPAAAINESYAAGVTDEYIEPLVFADGRLRSNDAVILFNFREDSARQLAYALAAPDKVKFEFSPPENLLIVTMSEYEKGLPVKVAFGPQQPRYTLARILAQAGKTQFRVAETEKYAHITYFFNSGSEEAVPGEERKLVPSLPTESFAAEPAMGAPQIGESVVEAVKSGAFDFILANFANADMLGHTGKFEAAVAGVEIVDQVLGSVVSAVLEKNGAVIITADHGNAEEMLDLKTGRVLTSHTSNPVPFWIVAEKLRGKGEQKEIPEITGILPDVTATILDLLGLPIPPEMDGHGLL